jgi:hypothetical protein
VGEGANAVAATMKALLIAAGVIALSLAIVGGVVFGLNDQETFVPPPKIVAEEFLRALDHGRLEPARSMLTSEAERTTSIAEVGRIATTFQSGVGRLADVTGAVAERRPDTTFVRAHVEGRRARGEVILALVRERGVWSVARISEMLPPQHEVPR